MPAIDILIHDIHVSFGESGLWQVILLRYRNYVPHVAVKKVKPEVGLVCKSYLTPHHHEPASFQRCWERYLIGMSLLRGGLLPPPLPRSPIPRCVGLGVVPAANPRLDSHHTLVTEPAPSAAPGMVAQPLPSVSHMRPPKFCHVYVRAVRPWSLSSFCFTVNQPGKRGLWGHETTSATSPFGVTLLVLFLRINTPQGPTLTSNTP